MDLRSGRATSFVASVPPQRDEESCVGASRSSTPPPILSPQITATEAMNLLDTQDVSSDTELLAVADTLLSMGARHSASALSRQSQQQPILPLPTLVPFISYRSSNFTGKTATLRF